MISSKYAEFPTASTPTIQHAMNDSTVESRVETVDESLTVGSSLPLIREFCLAMTAQQINYCHWKSNQAIDRTARGDNDLDLLVARNDIGKFTAILYQFGFKEAYAPEDQQMPGVQDYYGYDEPSGRIVHVHAHYQLIIGQDMTKNYHLPIEKAYLASSVQDELFRVADPAFELIVFIIRMIIKHATLDTMLGGLGHLSKVERRELDYLQAKADPERVKALLQEHLAFIPLDCFERCQQALQVGSSTWLRIRAGWDLQKRLGAYTRSGYISDSVRKVWRRATWKVRRLFFGKTSQRHLARGGALIAVVGGDGSGKTTTINELYSWLAADFDVTKVHLGKPGRSLATRSVRAALKAIRAITFTPYVEDLSVFYEPDTPISRFTAYELVLRALCVARDRYREFVKARRMATSGRLVICDRFPLAQIKMMEAPQIERIWHGKRKNRLLHLMERSEKEYNQLILPPELLIVLQIDPEIAVKRRAGERSLPVQLRNQEIMEVPWDQSHAYVVNTSRPKEEIMVELKKIVWAKL